jgi:hypothetical protein
MSTRVSLIFPYIGNDDKVRDKLIQIIAAVRDPANNLHTSNKNPVLIVNNDTIYRKMYEKFEGYLGARGKGDLLNKNKIDITPTWAVDTCQMWLAGFGKIIDDKREDDNDKTTCILQIPGDLSDVRDFPDFLNKLSLLSANIEANRSDFVIGDFEVEPEKAKHLIDMFGTYPLIFNWFPDVAKNLQNKGIKRPRSEFLAASLEFLEKMLPFKRKFAYEETLALLIHALSDTYLFSIGTEFENDLNRGIIQKELRDKFKIEGFPISECAKVTKENEDKWMITGGERTYNVKKEGGELNVNSDTKGLNKWKIAKVNIGVIQDIEESRGFRGANDQIERTERLLKLLWREMNGGDDFDVDKFERLDRRSTAIREAAIVSLGNFLR